MEGLLAGAGPELVPGPMGPPEPPGVPLGTAWEQWASQGLVPCWRWWLGGGCLLVPGGAPVRCSAVALAEV